MKKKTRGSVEFCDSPSFLVEIFYHSIFSDVCLSCLNEKSRKHLTDEKKIIPRNFTRQKKLKRFLKQQYSYYHILSALDDYKSMAIRVIVTCFLPIWLIFWIIHFTSGMVIILPYISSQAKALTLHHPSMRTYNSSRTSSEEPFSQLNNFFQVALVSSV